MFEFRVSSGPRSVRHPAEGARCERAVRAIRYSTPDRPGSIIRPGSALGKPGDTDIFRGAGKREPMVTFAMGRCRCPQARWAGSYRRKTTPFAYAGGVGDVFRAVLAALYRQVQLDGLSRNTAHQVYTDFDPQFARPPDDGRQTVGEVALGRLDNPERIQVDVRSVFLGGVEAAGLELVFTEPTVIDHEVLVAERFEFLRHRVEVRQSGLFVQIHTVAVEAVPAHRGFGGENGCCFFGGSHRTAGHGAYDTG